MRGPRAAGLPEVIGDDGFQSYWGFTGQNHQDILVNIVKRAIKFGGYSVVLLQPGSTTPACTATDTAIRRGHICRGVLPPFERLDVLEPQENPLKVSGMVTSAIRRAEARYTEGSLNVGILVSTLEHPHPTTSHGVVGGILIVPPSVVDGIAVRLA